MISASDRRALVVDDSPEVVALLEPRLREEGFEVSVARDGGEAVALARALDPDLIVLDLGLPVLDGVEVCREVRVFSDAYIIMLTARHDEVEKLIGLSVGADDYLTKPFSPRELLARVRAMMRRPRRPAADSGAPPGPPALGGVEIRPASRQVLVDGAEVALTRIEFDVLEALADRPRVVFTRAQIIERVWGPNWFGDEHVIDVHLSNLRRKLAEAGASRGLIVTVRGVGYRLDPAAG